MLKTIITLPDGTEISSGNKAVNAIQKSTITECVNSGEDLTIGSVCSNAFEASIFTPNGAFSIDAGTEITVEKEDEKGNRTRQGIFILEKPTRPSANMMKIIGYDRVSKLDKDLSSWLSGRTEWPYSLSTFAQIVCGACGLDYQATNILNGDFPVRKFSRQSVTGRQIMQWLGEICGSFCRANKDGKIEFAWYSATGVKVTSAGENYYFQNGLTFEDYAVAPVDAVQIRLADSADGALFPSGDGATNSYIITGNPILNSKVSQELVSYLDAIKNRLATVSYTPCKVELPATPNIHAGDILNITDKNGKQITAYVMAKIQTGQKDTLECTGNARRDSTVAVNNKTQNEVAQEALRNETPKEMFDRLTSGSKKQGLFYEDGSIVINGMYIKAKTFTAEAETFIEPGHEEFETIKAHVVGGVKIPDDKIALYDFNGDGSITVTDMLMCKSAMLGMSSLAEWSGARKTPVSVTIDVTDPNKAILMTGTNMWGRTVKLWYGLDGTNNGKFHGNVTVAGALMVGNEKLEFGEDADGNPVVGIGGVFKTVSWKSNGDGTYTMIGT